MAYNRLPTGNASTTVIGGIALAGDLGGTAASPSVLKANGATLPASPGAGDVGEGLAVSAANTLVYAPFPGRLGPFCAANLTASTAARYLVKRDTDGAASTVEPAGYLNVVPCVAYAIYVVLGTALPTANTTYTLMKGATYGTLADTGLTVTIPQGSTSGSFSGATATLAAGDVYVMKAVNSAADGATLNVRVEVATRPVT